MNLKGTPDPSLAALPRAFRAQDAVATGVGSFGVRMSERYPTSSAWRVCWWQRAKDLALVSLRLCAQTEAVLPRHSTLRRLDHIVLTSLLPYPQHNRDSES